MDPVPSLDTMCWCPSLLLYPDGLSTLSSFWTLAMGEKPAVSVEHGSQELGPVTSLIGEFCRAGHGRVCGTDLKGVRQILPGWL